MKVALSASVFFLITLLSNSQQIPGFAEHIYKQHDSLILKLHVISPAEKPGERYRPAIIFFFGGGWNSGRIEQFRPHAEYLSSRGMVAILADYRVRSRHNTTPFDAVADAKSAIRFLRKNFETLGIDTAKIAASGGSAGGHLAAAAATVPGLNDPADDLKINPRPNALILFNPVFDNGPGGYGYDRIGARYPEISPIHNIRPGTPATLIFLGTNDELVPVATAQLYRKKMEDAGCVCDLYLYDGQGHGFFNYRDDENNDNKYFIETLMQTDQYLSTIGYLTGEPSIEELIKKAKY